MLSEKIIQNKTELEIENHLTKENIYKTNIEEERVLQIELDSILQKGSGIKVKKKRKSGVKILADVKNAPENSSYFDFKTSGKLTEIGLKFDISSGKIPSSNSSQSKKENHENIYLNPVPSCSGVNTAMNQEVVENNDFLINDVVLVRYYVRKIWRYYIGFVQKIHNEDGKTLPLDVITSDSLVKKVRVLQDSKDYYLVDDFDEVYFV